jgi:hypothetical protein
MSQKHTEAKKYIMKLKSWNWYRLWGSLESELYDPIGSQSSFLAYVMSWVSHKRFALLAACFFLVTWLTLRRWGRKHHGSWHVETGLHSVTSRKTAPTYPQQSESNIQHFYISLLSNVHATRRPRAREKMYLKILIDFHVFNVPGCRKQVSGMLRVFMFLCRHLRLAVVWTVGRILFIFGIYSF